MRAIDQIRTWLKFGLIAEYGLRSCSRNSMKEFHRIIAVFNGKKVCEVTFHQSILQIFTDANYQCRGSGGGGGGSKGRRGSYQ